MSIRKIIAKPSAYSEALIQQYKYAYAQYAGLNVEAAFKHQRLSVPQAPYADFDFFMSTIHPTWKEIKKTTLPSFTDPNFPHDDVEKLMYEMARRSEQAIYIKTECGRYVGWGKAA